MHISTDVVTKEHCSLYVCMFFLALAYKGHLSRSECLANWNFDLVNRVFLNFVRMCMKCFFKQICCKFAICIETEEERKKKYTYAQM